METGLGAIIAKMDEALARMEAVEKIKTRHREKVARKIRKAMVRRITPHIGPRANGGGFEEKSAEPAFAPPPTPPPEDNPEEAIP